MIEKSIVGESAGVVIHLDEGRLKLAVAPMTVHFRNEHGWHDDCLSHNDGAVGSVSESAAIFTFFQSSVSLEESV